MSNIMIVDDEEDIISFISESLKLEGFTTITAYNGREAIEKLDESIHLIILDIRMPYSDGFEVAKILQDSDIPIIFLTAKDNLDTRLKCFSLGAMDYVVKPFYMQELTARIKNALGKNERNAMRDNIKKCKDLVINYDNLAVLVKGVEIEMTKREFEIIKLLSLNSNFYFSKNQIYDAINFNKEGSTQVVAEHIRKIRKKLSDYSQYEYIETKWGVGYKWLE
ncbi:response regulator transcription factor [Staphylococcus pettenkoferi]|uniref:response regulator transcription factor n=1 Tax=Staphylococcus pettenkoferi TaxID=170573 RepID=UPI0011A2AE9F|nr:response regulator transcription factor [Staphylococcus pettenkoferi]MCY1592467.1 response regulator transcription factor [Staphylococcus pettenkoferi]MCY1597453.1 response regulator transcription factor [Staphylococcus pettenkoferi]MCY1602623.1 response regulator transcription factor [Staphylococcus pettenkoferi]MCY1608937.1 response regulator transcription factor [Staphylococcus pettenkoferi]MCY1616447.1 response regulator transcription factor [Staphylococcus pettenkoferi]